MPKKMHKEFADVIQKISEERGEVAPQVIMQKFEEEYLNREEPFKLIKCSVSEEDSNSNVTVRFLYKGVEKEFTSVGNGPIDSLKKALIKSELINTSILDYAEHSMGEGSEAKAAAYVNMKRIDNGEETFGVGVDSNITTASMKAVFSAINRLYK